jgi:hypothetical protein
VNHNSFRLEGRMRPMNSSYDREWQDSVTQARELLARMRRGETVSYEECEAVGDPGWATIRDHVEEVPGEGYTARAEV